MATVLEIIKGLNQAAANAYDGALDENGELLSEIKTGEKLQEGVNYVAGDKYSYKFGIDGGDSRLREAIATGKLQSVKGVMEDFIPDVSKEYSKKHIKNIDRVISGYVDEGVEFGLVKGQREADDVLGYLGRAEKKFDSIVDIGFKYLMTKPNAYLSRSVVFKQYYY